MTENITDFKFFTKKGKTVTIVTCICCVAMVVLQMLISFKVSAAVGCNESIQNCRIILWSKILGIINKHLALVLLWTGPVYQVIYYQRTERLNFIRKSRKKQKNNKKRKKAPPNLSVVFLLLLLILIGACAAEIIPMKQDIDSNSFITYDGKCTVLTGGRGGSVRFGGGEKKILLNEPDIRVKGNTGLAKGEYNAHVVYSEKSKYIVFFSLAEEEAQ